MGKMMGRSLHSPMAVNTSGVNRGPAPERPISMLGFTCMHRQAVNQEGLISVPDFDIHTVTAWESDAGMHDREALHLLLACCSQCLAAGELLLSQC